MKDNENDISGWKIVQIILLKDNIKVVKDWIILQYHMGSHGYVVLWSQHYNYFINTQIISTPNQKIIDYALKFWENKYNSYFFILTNLDKNLLRFFEQYR